MGPPPDTSDILSSIKMLVKSVVQTVFLQQRFTCASSPSGTPSTLFHWSCPTAPNSASPFPEGQALAPGQGRSCLLHCYSSRASEIGSP